MRAKLRALHCPDIYDLENWSAGDEPFGIFIQAMIGPSDAEGEESFNLTLCTPEWFAANKMNGAEVVSPLHTLFVSKYDYRTLRAYLEGAAQRAEGGTWQQVAQSLSWLGEWEFENYRP